MDFKTKIKSTVVTGTAPFDIASTTSVTNLNVDLLDGKHASDFALASQVLTNVPAEAKFTDTVYTHPTTAGNKHIPTGGASGQVLKYSASGTATWQADSDTITTINGKTGAISKADITALGIPAQDTVYTHPNHSGDVTSVADGAQTIANNVVDNTKLAQVAVNIIKGRKTAGTGNVEDLTVSDVLAMLDVYTQTEADNLLANKAPLSSPALTGTPTAPTAPTGTDTTQIASTEFVQQELDVHKAENVSKVVLVTEPWDQLTKTTVNLGFKPKLVNVDACIRLTEFESKGYIDASGAQNTKFLEGGLVDIHGNILVQLRQNASNNIVGIGTITETGIEIEWDLTGTLTGISDYNRRLIIAAISHGEG